MNQQKEWLKYWHKEHLEEDYAAATSWYQAISLNDNPEAGNSMDIAKLNLAKVIKQPQEMQHLKR